MEEDSNRILLEILLIFLLIFINGLFSAAEIAMVTIRRTRVRQLIEEGDERAEIIHKLLDHPTTFMATVQIGVTLVGFLTSAYAAVNLAILPEKWLVELGAARSIAHGSAVIFTTLITAFFSLIFGEIAPKSIAMQHSEKLALSSARALRIVSIIAMPAVRVVSFCSDIIVRMFGARVKFTTPIVTEEELKMLVEAGEEEGVFEEEEKDMIHSIFDFTDTVVRQVMVPRTDMTAAPINCTLDELLEIITSTGYSRIPIYEDNADCIKGIVYAKDLLMLLKSDHESFDVSKVMRSAYFIPESKDINGLLAEFKHTRIQMAIVRDEYGGTAGLVTLEDLLEEIVGEIRDEYDDEEPLLETIDANRYIVNARMRVEELNKQLNLDIPEEDDYDTIGGFVFDLFGHQPELGDYTSFQNVDFVVHEIDEGRIQTIEIIRTDPPSRLDEFQNGKK